MEAIIGKLLSAFEQGKMSRRELVRGLALAAGGGYALSSPTAASAAVPAGASEAAGAASVGAAGAGAGAAAAAAGAFTTTSLDHISFAVADYGRSRDFYADLMGWQVTNDNGENQATLRIGDVGNIIIRNNRRPMPQTAREGRPPLTGVINHISWRIADFDTEAVRGELERRGLSPRRDQGGGGDYDSYHVLDPDGWDLQIAK